jgi:flagellar hook-length control protein FliK
MAHKRSENDSKGKTDVKTDATDSGATPATPTTESDTTAQEAQTTDFPVTPETLLALAVPPDTLKAVPASGDTAVDKSLSLDADAPTSGRKSQATLLQAGQLTDQTTDAQESATVPGDKPKFKIAAQAATEATSQSQAATATDAKAQTSPATSFAAQAATAAAAQTQATSPAAAVAGQLAATHQPDTLKIKELPVELMGHTTQHPTTQASFNLPSIDPLASSKLAPSVGTSAWSQALGDKVVWMAAGAQQTASLTLNPPNMGPLQIVLNITNDQATANFFSAQPEVRQALEAAFPKLREMMNEAGIQLGQATVSSENPRQNEPSDRQAQRLAAPFNVTDDGVTIGQTMPHAVIQHSGRGLVDTFA